MKKHKYYEAYLEKYKAHPEKEPKIFCREEYGIKVTINDRDFYTKSEPDEEFPDIYLTDGKTGCYVGKIGLLIANWDKWISELEKLPNVMTYPLAEKKIFHYPKKDLLLKK